MIDLIRKAKSRLGHVAGRHSELTVELGKLADELDRLKTFIEMANELAAPTESDPTESGSRMPDDSLTRPSVTVRRGSLAAKVAIMVRDTGPQTIGTMARRIMDEDPVGYAGIEDFTKFQNTVNSAVWRRKEDLFERRGELIELRTREFVLVEG